MMEMDTWKSSPIIRRLDGSWEIVYDGLPYYVSDMPGFEALYTKVTEYAEAHPEQVMDEPAPPAPTAAELLEQAKARKTADFDRVMADIDRRLIRPLANGETDIVAGINTIQARNRERRARVVAAETVEAVEAIEPVSLTPDSMATLVAAQRA